MTSTRILIVEDDYMTVEPIVDFLRIEGYTVDVSDDIADAFEKLEFNQYNYIFLDIMMAVGEILDLNETVEGRYTGLKLLELIRLDSRFLHHRQTPVALITNWREEPRIEASALLYRAIILRKPLAIATVKEALK